MSKTMIYNISGETSKEATLDEQIFGVKYSPKLVAQAIRTELANKRSSIANTKTRGEVSGGGRKPWKQKGTGNARAGSSRSPLWIGGGVTFGPRAARNFSLRMPSTMKQNALRAVLTDKAQEKKIVIIEDFELKEISTKKFVSILEKLPMENGKILFILPEINPEIELSAANLGFIKIIKTDNINAIDIANFDFCLITTNALAKIEKTLSKKN